ncbi:MFS transporter [Amycolatopsis pigmentata]|uniref:MFS transporter n=1 Tax=Amycolatopsis pigmentata TaxID=450801 RepID=A0ABW5G121_9PSEU
MGDDTASATVSRVSAGERLDRLPLSRWHRRMVLLIGLGSFFNFYEVALGSFFGVLLTPQWHLSPTQQALVVGVAFIGEMIGSLTLAPLADRFGRRLLFQVNLISYAVLSLAGAFSPGLGVFLVLRVLTGIGLGAELTLVDTYLSEMLPAAKRGRCTAWSYTLGLLAVPVAGGLAKSATGTVFGIAGWRWLLGLAALGGVAVWLSRRRLPESPRWLAATGREAEAEAVVRQIERAAGADPERVIATPERKAPETTAATGKPGADSTRRRSLLLWAMWILGPIGFYGFASIAPIVLLAKGFDLQHSLMFSALTAIGYPLGSLVSVHLCERVERRNLLIGSTLAIGVFGTVFGSATSIGLILVAGTASTLSSVVQSNVSHIYQAELFHSGKRSTSIALPYSASRLVSALLPLVAVGLLARIGAGGMYAGCAALLVALAVLVRFLGPRTNNRRLDTI